MFPALLVDTLPSELPGKSKNTGVGTLLQGIFPNQGLLHCRQILYQLSYQGSPFIHICVCLMDLFCTCSFASACSLNECF